MFKQFRTIAVVILVSTALVGCTSWNQIVNKIQATLTKADEIVLANQDVFVNACAAGGVAHAQFRAQVEAGIIRISAKDEANEQALYEQGRAICYPDPARPNTILPPDSLKDLLADIPAIQAWVKKVAILMGKVN